MFQGSMIEIKDCHRDPNQLRNCIGNYLTGEYTPIQLGSSAEMIADILIGSKRIRLGNAPSDEHRTLLISRIHRYLAIGAPIEIITLWGAVKGYGLDDDRIGVDIADLMALRRFTALNDQIVTIYQPGLLVRIIREDVGEVALNTRLDGLSERISQYSGQLDNLCSVTNITCLRFEDESVLLVQKGLQPAQFLERGMQNTVAIRRYWDKSTSIPESDRPDLQEYKDLLPLGWNGTIPDVMRDSLIQRVGVEHKDAGLQRKIHAVCTYLGVALARYQIELYKGSYEDRSGIIQPLKASFVPYPAGTPYARHVGRLEYKVKDAKNSGNSTPPWCGFGFMVPKSDNYEPSIIGLSAYRDNPAERVVASVNCGGRSQTFRADILYRG